MSNRLHDQWKPIDEWNSSSSCPSYPPHTPSIHQSNKFPSPVPSLRQMEHIPWFCCVDWEISSTFDCSYRHNIEGSGWCHFGWNPPPTPPPQSDTHLTSSSSTSDKSIWWWPALWCCKVEGWLVWGLCWSCELPHCARPGCLWWFGFVRGWTHKCRWGSGRKWRAPYTPSRVAVVLSHGCLAPNQWSLDGKYWRSVLPTVVWRFTQNFSVQVLPTTNKSTPTSSSSRYSSPRSAKYCFSLARSPSMPVMVTRIVFWRIYLLYANFQLLLLILSYSDIKNISWLSSLLFFLWRLNWYWYFFL